MSELGMYYFFGFIPPPSLKSGGAPGSFESLVGLGVKKWYIQTERGSNPEPMASKEDAVSTPPTPPGVVCIKKEAKKIYSSD